MYGLRTLARSARWLRSRFRGRALILGYHRISECSWDPYSLSVTPKCFAEQLEVLRKHATVISLESLTDALQRGEVLPRSVAITMDDGYADNLHFAKTLLQRHECPATVFVATGYIGKKFWWDELADILEPHRQLPDSLNLIAPKRGFKCKAIGRGQANRRELVHSIYRALRFLPRNAREASIYQLRAAAGGGESGDECMRGMTDDEIRALAKGEFITIGAHTVNHPYLRHMSASVQTYEIHESKRYLEHLLTRPVDTFCFPNGSFSDQTLEIVQQAEFRCACTTRSDLVYSESNPFCLPRLWAPNYGGAQFSRWLDRWLPSV